MQFWSLTPRELALHLAGAARRLEIERDARAWLAWHTAAFGRVKQMPDLAEVLEGFKPKKPQTADEQWATFMRFAKRHNRSLE